LPLLFGSQQSQVARVIAQQCALSPSSTREVQRVAMLLLLACLGRLRRAGTLDAGTFAQMLREEPPHLRGYLPADLLGSAAGVVRGAPRDTRPRLEAVDDPQSAVPPRWLAPVAITAALLVAAVMIRSLTRAPESVPPVATVTAEATNTGASARTAAAEDAATAAWSALGDLMQMELPDGSELNVPALGLEARLVRFLSDRSAPVSDARSFDFDRLLFDTGKATLQSASTEQLANIAAILKAYPQVKIRIAGFTDNSGDPAANLRLSEERADNVMDELVKLGIDPARMSARGYGQASPLADNASEQGRQKNRRISLRVTDKLTA
jgi:OmpA-OmpF porin, OOP family